MTTATILGCAGLALDPSETAFLRDADPWGFIVFGRNVESPDQLRRLTDALRNTVGRDAPVFIDQEGGRVQRLRAPHWREWVAPLEQVIAASRGAAAGGGSGMMSHDDMTLHDRPNDDGPNDDGPNDDRSVYGFPDGPGRAMALRYRLIAAELRAVGIDANCAPTCDIAGPLTHPFLYNRCLGLDPDAVAGAARGAAGGMLAGGVLPVIKHIPGHGRANADSHLTLPVVTATRDELRRTDFAPFRALADLPMAMTAHVVYTALDPDLPATLSPRVIAAIREDIGFDGLLMTDDMSMQALSGDLGSLSAAAIGAGCDIVLHCNGDRVEMAQVVAAAGRLEGRAAERAEKALEARRPPDDADLCALERELGALALTRAGETGARPGGQPFPRGSHG